MYHFIENVTCLLLCLLSFIRVTVGFFFKRLRNKVTPLVSSSVTNICQLFSFRRLRAIFALVLPSFQEVDGCYQQLFISFGWGWRGISLGFPSLIQYRILESPSEGVNKQWPLISLINRMENRVQKTTMK